MVERMSDRPHSFFFGVGFGEGGGGGRGGVGVGGSISVGTCLRLQLDTKMNQRENRFKGPSVSDLDFETLAVTKCGGATTARNSSAGMMEGMLLFPFDLCC